MNSINECLRCKFYMAGMKYYEKYFYMSPEIRIILVSVFVD